jgi:DNA-binding LacI/PurR family transcriptional regulator
VSRVINNRPGVRPELRLAVEKAIREHGLDVDVAARALRSRTTRRLAVIIPRPGYQVFANPFFTEILRGVSTHCEGADYTLEIVTSASPDTLREVNRNRRCDGVLFIGFRKNIPDPTSLRGAAVPVVTVPRPGPRYGLPFVGMDDEDGARQAVHHLVDRGHARIALVNGPRSSIYSIGRLAGYRAGLAEAGLPFDATLVHDGEFTREGAYRAMMDSLQGPDSPTAVLAASDHMAVGVLAALRQQGVRVPEDMAVVGFGNTPICSEVCPSLTSVDEQLGRLGAMAAEILVSLVQGKEVAQSQVMLPTELVVREST